MLMLCYMYAFSLSIIELYVIYICEYAFVSEPHYVKDYIIFQYYCDVIKESLETENIKNFS